MAEPQEVRIVHEDGRFGSVPASNLAEAERLGWRVEDVAGKAERKKGTVLETVATSGAAGVAGGLLMPAQVAGAAYELATGNQSPVAGLSGRQFVEDVGALMSDDVVQGANETRDMLEANLEARPVLSTVSEIAGQVVGTLPFGGLAGASGKAAAAGLGLKGAWATRGATAITGALEGGALGATAVAEEAWIRDEVATAEHTLAGMGLGTLLGGGVAVGMSAVGAGLGRLFGRSGKAAAAADGAVPGLAGAGDDLAARGSALLDDAPRAVAPLEAATAKAGKAETWLANLSDDSAVAAIARQDQRAMREIGGPRGNIAQARQVGRVLKETGIVRGAAAPREMLERAKTVAQSSGKRIGDVLAEIQSKGGFVEGKALMSRVDEHIAKFADDGWTPEMAQIATKLRRTVARVRERSDAGILEQTDLHAFRMQLDKSIKWGSAQQSVATDALRELRGIVEEGIESEVARIGKEIASPDLLREYTRSKEIYRASRWAEETLSNRVGVRDQANRFFSLTDYGVGLAGAVSMGPAGALLGGAAALGNKLARERGAGLVADVTSRFARETVDMAAAPGGAQGTARALRSLLGGVDEKMSTRVSEFFGRADGARSVSQSTRRAGIGAVLTEGKYSERRAAYTKHAEQVAKMASMPEAAAAGLAGLTGQNLPAVAPRLNAAMAATVARAAQYLQAHAPAPAKDPGALTPYDDPPPVSDGDLHAYAARVEGVTDPLSLLDDLARGDVDPLKVEAVKAVWPQLFEGIRAKVMGELALRQAPVPEPARRILDIALGADGLIEPSLAPSFMQTMAEAGEQQEQEQPRPPSGPVPQISQTMTTRSERIASM